MTISAESVNEIGTKQIEIAGSRGKNDHADPDTKEKECCPLRNIIRNIEQKNASPSIDLLSSEIGGLSTIDRASAIKALQSTRGNRYVQRIVAQAKLAISQPGDEYEQEADRVAQQVMNTQEIHFVQRKSFSSNEDDNHLLHSIRLAEQTTPSAKKFDAQSNVHYVLNSPGQPLSPVTRRFMESRFGHGFGHVRIHADSQAAKSARAVNALAFTVGRDIVFGAGRYAPEAREGQLLLAHELTHVVQQSPNQEANNVIVNEEKESRYRKEMIPQVTNVPSKAIADMGPRFGVRVHSNSLVAEPNRSANAITFPISTSTMFVQGQYAPGKLSKGSQSLIAHEIAHFMQPHSTNNSMLFRQNALSAESAPDNPRAQMEQKQNECILNGNLDLTKCQAKSDTVCKEEISKKEKRNELIGGVIGGIAGGVAGGLLTKAPMGVIGGIGAGIAVGYLGAKAYNYFFLDMDDCRNEKNILCEEAFESTKGKCKEEFNPENVPLPPAPINVEDLPIYEPPPINVEDLPIAK